MTNRENLCNINVRDRIVPLIYSKLAKAVEKDKHFKRNTGKGHKKEIYDRRKIKRTKPNKKFQSP